MRPTATGEKRRTSVDDLVRPRVGANVRFTHMAHAAALTVTQKIALALTMVLSLSTLLGVYPLPTHYTEETRALAQYPVGPTQRTPQEIDELFRSLMHERWIGWLLTLFALVGTLAAGVAVLCRFRYWPLIAVVVSVYVLAIVVPPMFRPTSGPLDLFIHFLNVFRAKPLDGMWGLWIFFLFPLLYGILALLALLALFKAARGKLRESNL